MNIIFAVGVEGFIIFAVGVEGEPEPSVNIQVFLGLGLVS